MSHEEYREYYNFITEVVHEAGQIVHEAFHAPKKVETKDVYGFVTESDRKVEEFIVTKIKQQFPEHLIIAEESMPFGTSITLTDAPTWIIDPIDGTHNFINEIPVIAISVALAIKKQVVVGVVFNPIINQFYSSIRGAGAYCNSKKINSSKNQDLHRSIIGNELSIASIPFLRERTIKMVTKLAEFGVFGMRSFGSAAVSLCFVADGSLDVYFTEGLQCWDVAAGVLILEEAGGCASNSDGREFDMFSRQLLAAGNKSLQEKFLSLTMT